MFLIDSNGSVGTPPTPAALGTEGFFGGGNPGAGQLATQVTPDWLNAAQNGPVVAQRVAGMSDSKTDYTQLYQAILACARLVDTGAVNALAATPAIPAFAALPALSAIPDGFTIRLVPAFTNTTTTPTFAFNGGAPITITTPLAGALAAGMIQAGVPCELMKVGGGAPAWWLISAQAVPVSGQSFNSRTFTTTTRVSMSGTGTAPQLAWNVGTYAKQSGTSVLKVEFTAPTFTPSSPGTGCTAVQLAVGATLDNAQCTNNTAADSRGETTLTLLLSGIAAGALAVSVSYYYGGIGATWDTVFCPQTSDANYFDSATKARMTITEIVP